MSLLKYLERAKRMDDLIRRRATGNADEFARKLGISRSVLMEHIRDLKEMGAPIKFCEFTRGYYYAMEYTFMLGKKVEMRELKGGFFFDFYFNQSDITGLYPNIFISQD
jgi:predicted DNA-binding transcriptional regulator YafY